MRKFIFSSLMVLNMTTFSISAETVNIKCDEAKKASRSDQIAAVIYVIDTGKMTGRASCAKGACPTFSFDGSEFGGASQFNKCTPNPQRFDQYNNRQTYQFFLSQEDEFDNFVTLTVTSDCTVGAAVNAN